MQVVDIVEHFLDIFVQNMERMSHNSFMDVDAVAMFVVYGARRVLK
jgi:hypothetical protein